MSMTASKVRGVSRNEARPAWAAPERGERLSRNTRPAHWHEKVNFAKSSTCPPCLSGGILCTEIIKIFSRIDWSPNVFLPHTRACARSQRRALSRNGTLPSWNWFSRSVELRVNRTRIHARDAARPRTGRQALSLWDPWSFIREATDIGGRYHWHNIRRRWKGRVRGTWLS